MTGAADAVRQEGIAHHQAGRLGEALQAYARALEANPGDWNALHLMGVVAADLGDLERAARMIGTAIANWPADATFHNNLGNALREADPARAEMSFRRALALRPASAPMRTNLAAALAAPGRGSDEMARHLVASSLALAPVQPDAWWIIGDLDQRGARLARAEVAFCCGLALDPSNPRLWRNLGHTLLQRLGRLEAALAAYDTALLADPRSARSASDRLFALGYRPSLTAADLRAAAEAWDRAHGAPRAGLIPPPTLPAAPEAGRKLRVGYVSADLGRHPVGFFLAGVLAHHQAVEAVVYSDRRSGDNLTRRLKSVAALWRDTTNLPDARLAETVRVDGIDILVDCAGHTGNNRLTAFALHPAPVQMTGFGHGGTTGLAAIDYLITDPWQTPPGLEEGFTERLLVMPEGYVCYVPPEDAPPVGPPPMVRTGYPVLGSFNTLMKHNDDVFALWVDVLRAVPTTRLLMKGRLLDDRDNRAAVRAAFEARGIDPDRLLLEGGADNRGMLAAYGRVDLALDPFPYGGGLTTLEALWMGVPVVTLGGGERFTARHAEAHLDNAGLGELVARDEAGYVRLVCDLVADPDALARRRAGLRDRVAASPIRDAARYTVALEAGYRRVWEAACRGEVLPKRVEINPSGSRGYRRCMRGDRPRSEQCR